MSRRDNKPAQLPLTPTKEMIKAGEALVQEAYEGSWYTAKELAVSTYETMAHEYYANRKDKTP